MFAKDGSNAYWSVVQVRNPLMSVAAIGWQDQSDASKKGGFVYANPRLGSYYLVPSEALQANTTFDITVTYWRGPRATIALTSAELATAESSYPF